MNYPKRLIEVDLPIKRISEHARREKSIRHGHISTLHIWWARRPLAACRAILCAALWPDPADELCPQEFRDAASQAINSFAQKAMSDKKLGETASENSMGRWNALTKESLEAVNSQHWNVLRYALLDFIADFANWDNSANPTYLETSRKLTQAAHEALGGLPGTRPLVADPFAGGGAIPMEALRVGADAFASDLNPVAILLNKVVLEYIPQYGQRLANEVRKWGQWVKEQAEKELAELYPPDLDGATPIAYLWARTITCEGPGCGVEVPLLRSLWLAKRKKGSVALKLIPNPAEKRVDCAILEDAKSKDVGDGTVARGAATCPCCGYTTPVESVRKQLKSRRGGTFDARLITVIMTYQNQTGKFYRLPNQQDYHALYAVSNEMAKMSKLEQGISPIPDESTEHYHSFVNRGPIYGMTQWSDYFTHRQALSLATLSRYVREIGENFPTAPNIVSAIQTCLALAVSRQVDYTSSLCTWHLTRETLGHTFTKQALPMIWDFAEVNPFSNSTGDFSGAFDWIARVCETNSVLSTSGQVERVSATSHALPNDMVQAFVTDPPYYYSVQYADLSDYFYVWLKRILFTLHPNLFEGKLTPKEDEIIVQSPGHEYVKEGKNNTFYEERMTKAMQEGHRILSPSGIGIVVFAHKSTKGWESQLQSMVDAGWTITGSWPIDTEMAERFIARNRAVLASSIHLVCRPRTSYAVGDWRDILNELPKRIHAWLPRLAQEGVVGADAVFACLGPALEIFSRYARVEKAGGEVITLGEYLEYVWGAVSREALNMVFTGADTTGFEEDARLTAMWLWTLSANGDEAAADKVVASAGYTLEYDAARKIAQGLGAYLEQLDHLVEVKGSNARLLPVAERTKYLFGKEGVKTTPRSRKQESGLQQLSLLEQLPEDQASEWRLEEQAVSQPGRTILDRVHQAMLLFASGRSDALKRFLVADGVGQDESFWRLAQALSALYPANTDEKRWVDGILARKKGLGF